MKTIKSYLHTYYYNLDNQEDRKAYSLLVERLTKDRKCFSCIPSRDGRSPDAGPIEIETKHLFSNQYNTTSGFRVFDWFEKVYEYKAIKEGHYIDLTEELQELKRNTLVCGFCGHQEPAAKGNVFCDQCLDSEYLKESEIHLLRLKPVMYSWPKRDPLTEAEKAWLMPQYTERQFTGKSSRNAQKLLQQRKELKEKYDKETLAAREEYDGLTWLMDRRVSIDNVIYYSHIRKFSFGWRFPVSEDVKNRLLDALVEFPFAYEIKAESGKLETRE